jgi:tetratricopeptide (TPR) repeat protein
MLKVQAGEVRAVLDLLTRQLEVHSPESEQILEALALGSLQLYLLDKAGSWAYELLEKFPKNPAGSFLRARLTDASGDCDLALSRFRELVRAYPRYVKARLHLTELLMRTKAYPEAAEHYAELCRQRPDDVDGLLGLARCHLQAGRMEEARPLLKRLAEKNTDRADVLIECGRFALSEERFAEAEPFLRRAVVLAPGNHDALYCLGICLQHVDQNTEGDRHLQRSREILSGLNEIEKVVTAIGKAPGDAALRLQAARLYFSMDQRSEGLRWLGGAVTLAPHDAAVQHALREFHMDPERKQ